MTVEVELPDGRTVEFPDGVTPDVIQRTTKNLMGGGDKQPTQDEYSGAPTTIDYQLPKRDDVPRQGGIGDPGTLTGAVAEGWRDAPSVWTSPEARRTVANLPVSGPILAPAGDILSGIIGAGNALLRGAQHVVAATAEPIGNAIPEIRIPGYGPISGTVAGGPGLGSDVAALPEAFPTGDFTGGTVGPQTARNQMMPPERPQFVSERIAPPRSPGMTDLERMQQLIQHDIVETNPAPSFVPPGTPRPDMPAVPTNDILRSDPSQQLPRPAFVPPTTTRDPVTGEVKPIQQPPPEPAPAVPGAHAEPVGTDAEWLSGLHDNVQQVLRENGRTSLGAMATPEELAQMTPAQVKANRRMAELGEIMSPPGLGRDNRTHVEGSIPTLAEAAGDPATSQLETVLRARNANQFDPRLSANSQARIRQFDAMSGTDPQLITLNERQAAAAKADTARIQQNLQPADGQPLLKYYDDILNDPRIREREDVVAVLKPLRDKLFDENGSLKTDAMSYWGMHDNIMAALAKAKDPLKASGAEKFAFDQLLGAKNATDAVMNQASGGAFQTFLDNQAQFFQQKNAMEVLQKFRTGMVDAKTGHIYADKFHRWLADLAVRRGKPGVDPAMDIPDNVMRGLISIDTDLKRASRIDLGKARGSGTNLFFEVAKAAGLAGAHVLAGLTTGGTGNFVLQQALPGIANWRLNRLTQRHLAPPAPESFPANDLGP